MRSESCSSDDSSCNFCWFMDDICLDLGFDFSAFSILIGLEEEITGFLNCTLVAFVELRPVDLNELVPSMVLWILALVVEVVELLFFDFTTFAWFCSCKLCFFFGVEIDFASTSVEDERRALRFESFGF